jgi:hypothetical protein
MIELNQQIFKEKQNEKAFITHSRFVGFDLRARFVRWAGTKNNRSHNNTTYS